MRRILGIALCLLLVAAAQAQQYKLSIDGFVMPDMNSPVSLALSMNDGDGFEEVPARKYTLQSPYATLARTDRYTHSFMLDRQAVYEAKGKVPFTAIIGGKSVALIISLPILQSIRFNLYTDSIKPILNYYVNVEGTFSDGKVLPVDTSLITVTADYGRMAGMEWLPPRERNFEKVTFSATSRYNAAAPPITVTRYLKKAADPRDAPDYRERTEEEIIKGKRR